MSTKNKLSRIACAIGATTLLGASLLSGVASAAEKIRWQVPLAFPSHLIGLTTPVKHLSESLKAVSGGDIQLRYYEPGEL
nr:C4-dicarboxylate ABC transporter [Stutzerimonas stutzeri]